MFRVWENKKKKKIAVKKGVIVKEKDSEFFESYIAGRF